MERLTKIPREVINCSEMAIKEIIRELSDRPWYHDCKVICFSTRLTEDKEIDFTIEHHRGYTNEENDDCYISGIQYNKSSIILTIKTIEDDIDYLMLSDIVMHEIYHCYEAICFKGRMKRPGYYNKNNFFNPTITIDECRWKYVIEQNIRHLLYCSVGFEQRAYYAGAYGAVRYGVKMGTSVEEALNKTTLYWMNQFLSRQLLHLKSSYNDIKSPELKRHIDEILKWNCLGWKQFLKIAERTVRNWNRNCRLLKEIINTELRRDNTKGNT